MRDYKFRGKTKNGEWIYGSLVVTTHGLKTHTKTWIVQSAFGNGGWFNIIQRQYVLPKTVGQFTGLLDKNGVEIYEGDIVCNEGFKEKVYWDEFYGWVVSDEAMLGEVNFARIQVIGNIYENHELLELK